MKPQCDPTSAEFFEQLYRERGDPWNFASCTYELDRYQTILRSLDGRRYSCTFEPGCAIGVLTHLLATVCDRVVAMDISVTAVAAARERCRSDHNTSFFCGELPASMPNTTFDLIVLSEIGYYFTEERLRNIGRTLTRQLRHGGNLLAAHWLGSSEDHLLHGDQVHAVLTSLPALAPIRRERHAGFLLDVWNRL